MFLFTLLIVLLVNAAIIICAYWTIWAAVTLVRHIGSRIIS